MSVPSVDVLADKFHCSFEIPFRSPVSYRCVASFEVVHIRLFRFSFPSQDSSCAVLVERVEALYVGT